ncbi:iron-sulfur cluster carrier protein ApbC [Pseudofulvimonas gallinarii]|jgi:ATP-binding protein involved in chromosome partitioning|uniref:Iron-sulfur cluster carrier protein n=1 Tax=Pseudofulvimonas gallinarii TaxID=634155 RepID=A0A4S3L2Q3_9GAMM|nr:iron-sulfur cluster carrier protein ApbC [Pseudofulvimonas gallinarii]TCT01340.1 ATP-binding protein involved in chromosome partitioning [Pseudofulvimonas gallinarii]THD15094.1 Fe-S-binding ATPase [Pseudofulvimonas gallinarii]
MAAYQDQVRTVLSDVVDPDTGTDLVGSGAFRGAAQTAEGAVIDLVLGYPGRSGHDGLRAQVQAALAAAGLGPATISIDQRIVAHVVKDGLTPLPEVKNIIAVASGKGGVGKSTTAVNLALALAAEGANVGVLDADIYGPSVPRMLGVSGRPHSHDNKHFQPMIGHGLQCMSIGFMVDEETPMIWRGPMVTQAMQQMLNQTAWSNLDYLVVDLPPGTGDIQLSLSQKVPVSGAIIVTTPQDIALLDARRAVAMFAKVDIPVLGVVENMSTHRCSNCGHVEPVFGEGGGARMAEEQHVPLLGQLPLALAIREQADGGRPTVVAAPDSDEAAIYRRIARGAAGRLSLRARNKTMGLPKVSIE